jgi:hypothetical protein
VMFLAQIRGPGVTSNNNFCVWLEPPVPGAPLILLSATVQGPGLPAGLAARPVTTDLALDADGRLACPAVITGTGVTAANDSALYAADPVQPGVMRLLAREGEQVPGQPAGVLYGTFGGCGWTAPTFAAGSSLICRASLTGMGVTTDTDGVFLLFVGGVTGIPEVVLREGGFVPGPNMTASLLFVPQITSGYDLAFYGRYGVSPNTSAALHIGPPSASGPFRAFAATGGLAPGIPGLTINQPDLAKFTFNVAKRSAYSLTLAGAGVVATNDSALYTEGPMGIGNPILLAREGSSMPGVAAPANLSSANHVFASIAINDRNQTAYFGVLTGTGITANNDNALWAMGAADTSLSLVAREQDPFTLNPGDVRTVSLVGYRLVSGTYPWRQWLNDQGAIVLPLQFTDNTGALVIAMIDPPPACIADFNLDGNDTLQDLFDFLQAWFQQVPAADINGIDGVTVQDLFEFLVAWFTGCP